MENPKDKVLKQIHQLQNLSNSTHSKSELEACLTAIQNLMTKHQISEAELEQHGEKKEEMCLDQNSENNIIFESGKAPTWKTNLAFGLAKLNGLYALKYFRRGGTSHKRGSVLRAFGRVSDIEITKYMFKHLEQIITDFAGRNVPSSGFRGVNPERESWALGCVEGFLFKMKVEKDAVLQQSNSTAMVLVSNRVEESKEALFKANPKLKVGKPIKSKMDVRDSYTSGFAKGQTLSVNPALKGA